MARVRRAVVFMAAAFIASAGAMAPAAAGKFGDVVSATVPPGSMMSPGRFYLLEAKPGDTVTQDVRVSNPNDHQVTVMVEAVDAATGDLTGVQLGGPGSPKALTSRWIVVSTPQITLAPNQQRDVPFTVHVPLTAKPGQFLAGVSASVPLSAADTKAPQTPSDKAGFSMAVRFQRAIAVEIDVAGPRAPDLAVGGAVPNATPDGVSLGIHIANSGNAFAHGTGVVRVPDTNTDFTFPIDTFVSETSIVFPMAWTKVVVPGSHHVEVDLTYEGSRRTSWSGTVVIAGAARNQLENSLRNVAVKGHSSGPGLLLIIAGCLFALFVAAAVMIRRRSRRSPPVNYRTA